LGTWLAVVMHIPNCQPSSTVRDFWKLPWKAHALWERKSHTAPHKIMCRDIRTGKNKITWCHRKFSRRYEIAKKTWQCTPQIEDIRSALCIHTMPYNVFQNFQIVKQTWQCIPQIITSDLHSQNSIQGSFRDSRLPKGRFASNFAPASIVNKIVKQIACYHPVPCKSTT